MKNVFYAFVVLFAFALPAFGQANVEFYGGYRHASGDQGLDGFNLGVGWSPIRRFQLYLNYDGVYDHSTLGVFELTTVGTTIVNSHMTGILTGPRYYFPGAFKHSHKIEGDRLAPFAEAGFGEYRLHTELRNALIGDAQAADTAFAWLLGGGIDYRVIPHWTVRGDLGLLRTHIAASGQSRVRLGLNVIYSFRSFRHTE